MSMPPAEPRKRLSQRSEPVILFAVAGTTFAIAATAVDEIRNLEGLQPFSPSPVSEEGLAKFRYRLERGGKTYCVVDASRHFHLLPTPPGRVLILRRGVVAVLVDRIDLMAEISAIYALPRAFSGEERRWYRGLAFFAGTKGEQKVVPVVNPDGFLSKTEAELVAPLLRAQGATP